eukprot:365584-Chlamydomonas_euryale.AAC.7
MPLSLRSKTDPPRLAQRTSAPLNVPRNEPCTLTPTPLSLRSMTGPAGSPTQPYVTAGVSPRGSAGSRCGSGSGSGCDSNCTNGTGTQRARLQSRLACPPQWTHVWPLPWPPTCPLPWPSTCPLPWPHTCHLPWPHTCHLPWPHTCPLPWPHTYPLPWPHTCPFLLPSCLPAPCMVPHLPHMPPPPSLLPACPLHGATPSTHAPSPFPPACLPLAWCHTFHTCPLSPPQLSSALPAPAVPFASPSPMHHS